MFKVSYVEIIDHFVFGLLSSWCFYFLFRIFHASQFKSTPLLSPPHHILETGSPWFDLLPCLLLWVCPCILPYWSSSGSLYSSLKTRNGSTLSSQCWLWENKNLCFSGYLSIKNIFSWSVIKNANSFQLYGEIFWEKSMGRGNSVQFSRSVMSNSLRPNEPQHTRPPCPSPTPRVYPNSCPLSLWCHLTI